MIVLLAAALAVSAGEVFACTPVSVWDGDGPIACAEGPKVRLAGIAAREIDGTCRQWQPCPRAGGIAARDALVRLLGGARGTSRDGHVLVAGPVLTCRSDGDAKGGRTAAWCSSAATGDLSCAMVRGGWALRWRVFWRGHRCGRARR